MATVANHRMYGMNLVCATAKQYIFQKVRILPLLLGQSLWSRDGDVYEEFKGMSAFLDLTPVGFDAGYNMYMDAI